MTLYNNPAKIHFTAMADPKLDGIYDGKAACVRCHRRIRITSLSVRRHKKNCPGHPGLAKREHQYNHRQREKFREILRLIEPV